MRLISENETLNLSYDKWDFSIESPYLTPPVFYIKATTDHREIIVESFLDISLAKFVLNEIQRCDSNGQKECRIGEIKERMKSNAKIYCDGN